MWPHAPWSTQLASLVATWKGTLSVSRRGGRSSATVQGLRPVRLSIVALKIRTLTAQLAQSF
jgi:hypothetical protein